MEHGVEVVAVMAAGTGGGSGVRSDAFHEKAVNQKLKFTSTRIPLGVVVHWVGVNSLMRADPPAPLGDGRGEVPLRGFRGS